MSLDPIVAGCSWDAVLFVGPSAGRTAADVTEDLTGATVTAALYMTKDDATPVATFGTSVDAMARTVSLSLAPGDTVGLAAKRGCLIDVRVATSGGEIYPVAVNSAVEVKRLSS